MMRAVLKAYHIPDRTVWCADSFEGLPRPDAEHYPADANDPHHTFTQLAVSLDQVKGNFRKYDLLDDQVKFLKAGSKIRFLWLPLDLWPFCVSMVICMNQRCRRLESLYDKVSLRRIRYRR